MRFCTMTLGCKVNQYETQAIESLLRECGHTLVTLGEGADVCILNTCAVTAESGRKSRQLIRRMKKLEPEAVIAVCGCYSELEPESVTKLGADIISGTSDRRGFALKVCEDCHTPTPLTHGGLRVKPAMVISVAKPQQNDTFEELPPGNTPNRTRALLKIQDGCSNFCTYCIVPHIRGGSRSLPLDRMAEYAKQLEDQGYKEIIITGIEISSTSPSLLTAIKTIQAAAPTARLRLGSLDPAIMTDEFCKELSKIPNLCNHIHLSLQSGCDETLRRMGRKYTASQVLKSIKSIRTHFNKNETGNTKNNGIDSKVNQSPDCAITADLITGFPGETEEEFNQTLEFIKKAEFSGMHIFQYSPRPGTKAACMPEQVEKSIKKDRANEAAQVAQHMENDFKSAQIGKIVEVLFEQEKAGYSIGHSSNYLEIKVKKKTERNSIKKVKVTGIKNSALAGEIAGEIV